MKRLKIQKSLKIGTGLVLLMTGAFCVQAANETSMSTDKHSLLENKTKNYTLVRRETPKKIKKYYTTTYVGGNHTVTTMRGDELFFTKDQIKDFALNPTGVMYAVVTENKKGERTLGFHPTREANTRLHKFDSKIYGKPSSVVFSPDGRLAVVSTDKGIRILETKKFRDVGEVSLVPMTATFMAMSPNGYYLVLANGKNLVIYNFEDKKIRQRMEFEVDVTDVVFSPDSKQMGVLTEDGLLSLYSTRTFELTGMVDELGEGLAFDYNDTGKYVAVATESDEMKVINLLKQNRPEKIGIDGGDIKDVTFISDALGEEILMYGCPMLLCGKRMGHLEPYYAKLVSDEVDMRMEEWLKMQPGESMEAYASRVSEENRKKQRRLFEDEISTNLAGDMLTMSGMSLGKYNKEQELLEVDFHNMPSIYLPVSKEDVMSFKSGEDLTVTEAQYGLLPDDNFELIYAKFLNKNDGKTYVYDNLDRVGITFLENEDSLISLEVLQQQQMEEMKLQEIRKKVVEDAKTDNIISDYTQISVDSRIVPDYDASGNRILNYVVKFSYEVAPGHSATEDFGPGKYHLEESGAAKAMMTIMQKAFAEDLKQYIRPGQKVKISISGSADSTPIVRGIPYDGVYGEVVEEPIYDNGRLSTITVTGAGGIKTNEQLAYLRAAGVKHAMDKDIKGLENMQRDMRYNIGVSAEKGSEFRRIETEVTFVDVFN